MSSQPSFPRVLLIGFTCTVLACAIVAALAWWTDAPLAFPAFGATTFIVFWLPEQPAAAPRNVLCAHLAGALIGWTAHELLGPGEDALGLATEWTARVLAPALALGMTCVLMTAGRVLHPPAGATTLIFATGLLARFSDVPWIVLGVAATCALAWIAHRATGRDYPVWSPHPRPSLPHSGGSLK